MITVHIDLWGSNYYFLQVPKVTVWCVITQRYPAVQRNQQDDHNLRYLDQYKPPESSPHLNAPPVSPVVTCSFIDLISLGNRILTLGEVPKDQVYGVKLKGVSVCFAMLKAVLSGNYVNFGVFRLYGDDALDNALQTFIKLLLSIPHSDLLVLSTVSSFSCVKRHAARCAFNTADQT